MGITSKAEQQRKLSQILTAKRKEVSGQASRTERSMESEHPSSLHVGPARNAIFVFMGKQQSFYRLIAWFFFTAVSHRVPSSIERPQALDNKAPGSGISLCGPRSREPQPSSDICMRSCCEYHRKMYWFLLCCMSPRFFLFLVYSVFERPSLPDVTFVNRTIDDQTPSLGSHQADHTRTPLLRRCRRQPPPFPLRPVERDRTTRRAPRTRPPLQQDPVGLLRAQRNGTLNEVSCKPPANRLVVSVSSVSTVVFGMVVYFDLFDLGDGCLRKSSI